MGPVIYLKSPRSKPSSRSAVFAPVFFVAVAVAITLWGTILAPRNGDDWYYLGYIFESQQDNPNLEDPFMGTNVDLLARYEYNVAVQGMIAFVDLTDSDPIRLFQEILPPILGLLSLLSVYLLLRAAGFRGGLAAFGCLAWVFYFLSSYWDFRLHGGYFFSRLAQDKAMAWLVLAPALLAIFLVLARLTLASPAGGGVRPLRQSGALIGAMALSLVSTLVHPVGAIFALAFGGALLLRSAWRRRSWPDPRLSLMALLAVVPAVATAMILRYVLPVQPEISFSIKDASADVGRADFDFIAGLPVVDPAFISLVNFFALLWIVYRIRYSKRTPALDLAACLYLVASPVFIPGVPDVVATVTSTPGVWRLTWLFPIAAVLAMTDFASWLVDEASRRQSRWGVAASGVAVALVAGVGVYNYGEFEDLESSEPDSAQLEVLDAIDAASARSAEQLVVLASNEYNRFIPSYAPTVDVVAFPLFGAVEDVDLDGERRVATERNLPDVGRHNNLSRIMRFWGAQIAVIEPGFNLFAAERPVDWVECLGNSSAVILVMADDMELLCPRGVQGTLRTCESERATIIGTEGDDVLVGTDGPDVILGLGGNDRINGLEGDDRICGGQGRDVIRGGPGDDIINGGPGRDTVSYVTADSGVDVDLRAGRATGEGDDQLSRIENIEGSLFDDTLRGDDGANFIRGFAGDDTIFGGGGDDRLQGGSGKDESDGGAGLDDVS